SPLITKPEVFDQMMTEPDVLPTLAGLTGHDGLNTTLGRNVFAEGANDDRFAFSYVYYTDPLQIVLYDQDFLAYGTENGIESLHQYNSEAPAADVKENHPEKFEKM